MNNAFPPPPSPPVEGVEIASVTNDHGPPWPKLKLLRLPLWAWISEGVLGLGAVGVAAAPKVRQRDERRNPGDFGGYGS